MKILINERQFKKMVINESLSDKYGKVYSDKVKTDKEMVWNLLKNNGKRMISNDNDKIYTVYYLQALSKIIGIDYVICRLISSDTLQEYGSTYVKPLSLFRNI